MFSEFTPIRRSLFNERVNTFLGVIFLGTCALWAALFVWNISTGSNPINHAFAAAIGQTTDLSQ